MSGSGGGDFFAESERDLETHVPSCSVSESSDNESISSPFNTSC